MTVYSATHRVTDKMWRGRVNTAISLLSAMLPLTYYRSPPDAYDRTVYYNYSRSPHDVHDRTLRLHYVY
eukprot:g19123.t1